jgi:hypothetical protein
MMHSNGAERRGQLANYRVTGCRKASNKKLAKSGRVMDLMYAVNGAAESLVWIVGSDSLIVNRTPSLGLGSKGESGLTSSARGYQFV